MSMAPQSIGDDGADDGDGQACPDARHEVRRGKRQPHVTKVRSLDAPATCITSAELRHLAQPAQHIGEHDGKGSDRDNQLDGRRAGAEETVTTVEHDAGQGPAGGGQRAVKMMKKKPQSRSTARGPRGDGSSRTAAGARSPGTFSGGQWSQCSQPAAWGRPSGLLVMALGVGRRSCSM